MMPPIAILAGGYAKRLHPITKTIPKAMLQVAGKPFILHQFDLIRRNGISEIVICSGYLSKQIEAFLGDGRKFDLSVKYSSDGENPLGTGGAVKKAIPLLGDVFFVMYGDSYLDMDFREVNNYFMRHNEKGLMTVLKNRDEWDKSNVVFENSKIVTHDKDGKTKGMEYIDYGLSMLRKSAFNEIRNKEVFDLGELYANLIRKEDILGYEVKKRFYEIGSAQGLAETEEYLLGLSKRK
ncbi:sugar phosphate nucleotidyltransferase [Candidatus Omnitrophota bacterium]